LAAATIDPSNQENKGALRADAVTTGASKLAEVAAGGGARGKVAEAVVGAAVGVVVDLVKEGSETSGTRPLVITTKEASERPIITTKEAEDRPQK